MLPNATNNNNNNNQGQRSHPSDLENPYFTRIDRKGNFYSTDPIIQIPNVPSKSQEARSRLEKVVLDKVYAGVISDDFIAKQKKKAELANRAPAIPTSQLAINLRDLYGRERGGGATTGGVVPPSSTTNPSSSSSSDVLIDDVKIQDGPLLDDSKMMLKRVNERIVRLRATPNADTVSKDVVNRTIKTDMDKITSDYNNISEVVIRDYEFETFGSDVQMDKIEQFSMYAIFSLYSTVDIERNKLESLKRTHRHMIIDPNVEEVAWADLEAIDNGMPSKNTRDQYKMSVAALLMRAAEFGLLEETDMTKVGSNAILNMYRNIWYNSPAMKQSTPPNVIGAKENLASEYAMKNKIPPRFFIWQLGTILANRQLVTETLKLKMKPDAIPSKPSRFNIPPSNLIIYDEAIKAARQWYDQSERRHVPKLHTKLKDDPIQFPLFEGDNINDTALYTDRIAMNNYAKSVTAARVQREQREQKYRELAGEYQTFLDAN